MTIKIKITASFVRLWELDNYRAPANLVGALEYSEGAESA